MAEGGGRRLAPELIGRGIALAMVAAGASRLGCSSSVAIIQAL